MPPNTAVVSHMKPTSSGMPLYSCHTKGRDKGDICNNEPCMVKFKVIHSVRCAFAIVCTHRHVHTIKLSIIHKAQTVLHVSAVNRLLEGDVNTKGYFTFQSLPVTVRTTRFNVQQFCMVITLHLRVLSGSQNKQ